MKLKLLTLFLFLLPFITIGQDQAKLPVFNIGAGTSRIWALDFAHAEEATISTGNAHTSDYVIREFTVTVLSDETKTYKTVKNAGSKLNDGVKGLFASLHSNDMVVIDGIQILNSAGDLISLPERTFRVR